MHVLTRLACLYFVVCRRESVKVGWKFEILRFQGRSIRPFEANFDNLFGKDVEK
jgi:hypothetical protein